MKKLILILSFMMVMISNCFALEQAIEAAEDMEKINQYYKKMQAKLKQNLEQNYIDGNGSNKANNIVPGKYIFISFSIPDNALKSYFKEAQEHGFKLIIRGLTGEEGENKFLKTKAKIEELGINVDIDPFLFEELNITKVPVMVIVSNEGKVSKVDGHIPLQSALKIMREEK